LKILTDNKADVRIKNNNSKTPLHVVGYSSKYETQKQQLCEKLLKKQIGDEENVL
jgi:hypothetical protein